MNQSVELTDRVLFIKWGFCVGRAVVRLLSCFRRVKDGFEITGDTRMTRFMLLWLLARTQNSLNYVEFHKLMSCMRTDSNIYD